MLVEFEQPSDSKPVWRFTLAVGARTDQSAAEIRDHVMVYVGQLNRAFNPDNVFAGRFEFALDSLFTYPDSSAETIHSLATRPRTANYLILLDNSSGQLGGGGMWFRHLQTIQIYTARPLVDAGDVLVHEMGHARGAADLYGYVVEAGHADEGFHIPGSIMRSGGHQWDTESRILINGWADRYPVMTTGPAFAQIAPLEVRVVDTTGRPVAGVPVEIIPANSTGRFQNPAASGVTNHQGSFIPSVFPLWLRPTLWIRAEVDGEWFSRFATQIDAVASHARRPGTAHVVTVPVAPRR